MCPFDPCATTEDEIKGLPVLLSQSQGLLGVSQFAVNCDKYNAVHFDVYVTGGSSAVTLTVEGCYAEHGIYQTLPDGQATQTITTNASFDVVVGTVWAQTRLGTVPAGQQYTIWGTPCVSSGQPTVNANIICDTLSAIQVDTGALNLSDWLTIGLAGGIYQGTGTAASPTTGLKVWNESGIGRIAGYNAGTVQWYADTDGKLYAGGGNVVLDSGSLSIGTPAARSGYLRISNDQAIVWRNGTDTGDVDGWKVNSANNLEAGTGVDMNDQEILGIWALTHEVGNFSIDNAGNALFKGTFQADGNMGFYGTGPVAQGTVTGSRGANAALASLLSALAATGLIVDSSTA